LRIGAAIAVLVSHAYPLALGAGTPEPLTASTGFTLGTAAVFVFFAISGFLISQSFDRRGNELMFWWARLVVAVTLTALVLGPIASDLTVQSYFRSPAVATYVIRNVTLFALQPGLPGVFTSTPYPIFVNGSLWTLFYEVACYAMVAVVGLLCRSTRAFALFVLAFVVLYVSFRQPIQSDARIAKLAMLSLPFVLGMLAYRARRFVPLSSPLLASLVLLCIVLHKTVMFRELFVASLTYGALYLGFTRLSRLADYNRVGDYSYGVYIYAFPIEQMTAWVLEEPTPILVSTIAFVPTLLLAILSWHLVEKPALRLKSLSRRRGRELATLTPAEVVEHP
jgi:peptidoglycan/LPS O-acetylase OafA/YrhL